MTLAELASDHAVSPVTVHRDLELLSAEGLLERVHGGARSLPGTRPRIETAWNARVREAVSFSKAMLRPIRSGRGRRRRAGEGVGKGGGLDGEGVGDAAGIEDVQELGGQAERGEGHGRGRRRDRAWSRWLRFEGDGAAQDERGSPSEHSWIGARAPPPVGADVAAGLDRWEVAGTLPARTPGSAAAARLASPP